MSKSLCSDSKKKQTTVTNLCLEKYSSINIEMLAFQNKKQQIQFPQFSIVAFSKYFNEVSKRTDNS